MAMSTWSRPTRRTRSTDAVPERVPGPTRRGRRFLTWAGGTVAVLLTLGTLGAVYQSAAEAADARAYPPPGRMVDTARPDGRRGRSPPPHQLRRHRRPHRRDRRRVG